MLCAVVNMLRPTTNNRSTDRPSAMSDQTMQRGRCGGHRRPLQPNLTMHRRVGTSHVSRRSREWSDLSGSMVRNSSAILSGASDGCTSGWGLYARHIGSGVYEPKMNYNSVERFVFIFQSINQSFYFRHRPIPTHTKTRNTKIMD